MDAHEHSHAIIIGAGLSGLAVGRNLLERGIAVKILEAGQQVAEPWRARHPQLRLNIHRHFAQLPGRAITRDDGTFVARDTVVDYLESYARDLGDHIQFGTRVLEVSRGDPGWTVRTQHGGYTCQHLIVATGRDSIPQVPDWPGKEKFTGELLHSAHLGDIRRFHAKKVLVIGAGNSGGDVLNHFARSTPAQVWVSVRHGPSIVPNRLLGFPIHRLARLFALFPAQILDPVFAAMQRLVFGDLTRFGLRSHPDGGGTRLLRDGVTFAIDDGFVAAIKQGRFQVVAETLRFDQERVYLADGSTLRPDVVICATGYRSGLESLLGHLGVLDQNGQPLHPLGERDKANPGLWFTGYRPLFTGYFDAAGIAARRIATAIAEESLAPRVAPRTASVTT